MEVKAMQQGETKGVKGEGQREGVMKIYMLTVR